MACININKEACKGCELCVSVCPKNIIGMQKDKFNSKGFQHAEVLEMDKCIGCAFCATICPDIAIEVQK